MKRLNLFVILLLIVLLAVILLIVQNNTPTTLNFFLFNFTVNLGLFGVLMFLLGLITMWFIALITHYKEISTLRKAISDCKKQLEETRSKENGQKI